MKIKQGDKVILKATAECGEEQGEVLEVGKRHVTVRVTPDDRRDDGLREITRDQIKEVIK